MLTPLLLYWFDSSKTYRVATDILLLRLFTNFRRASQNKHHSISVLAINHMDSLLNAFNMYCLSCHSLVQHAANSLILMI
ncbi:hypothetical protein BB561_006932 [Smittium simulii]|uniref:Uncharacterized protein n=1 Tax=Smittium simulii TaxID=133385 RepID=A0A2T9XZS5_9FUNG|nr:hypothetical protein BB561_006932 [Smittium simulii]